MNETGKRYPDLRRRPLFAPLLIPFLGGLMLLLVAWWAWNQRYTTTIIVVRHAEKLEQGADPGLSQAGGVRAASLVDVLRDVPVDALIASQYQRTQQTLDPLARARGLPVQIMDAADPAAMAARLLDAYHGSTVVVAGHSNTIVPLIEALGGEAGAPGEDEYDDIYIVSVPHLGAVRTVRLHVPGGMTAGPRGSGAFSPSDHP